jgi:hypothetical protein
MATQRPTVRSPPHERVAPERRIVVSADIRCTECIVGAAPIDLHISSRSARLVRRPSCYRWAMRARSVGWTLLPVLPVIAFGVASARADDDVRLEVALDLGYTYMNAHGAISEPSAASTTFPPTPTPFGSGNFSDSGFAIGGRFTAVAPYYGPGVPRGLALVGITGYFGRDQSAGVAAFHPGTANDSGVELKRNYAIDIAVGVLFPLCGQYSCMDLKAFFGGSIVGQTVTGFSNETTAGGTNNQSSSSAIHTGPLLGVIVSKPICTDCKEHSLRLELGTIVRSILQGGVDFTSSTGNSYSASASGLEFEFFAGLSLPL